MRQRAALACLFTSLASVCAAGGQGPPIQPIRVAAGTVLTFHLQTRLNPEPANEMDRLPRGTLIQVKLLEAIDSAKEADGTEFRGEVIEAIAAKDAVVIHSHAKAQGLLVLLRSRKHPDGFRYELLLTGVKDEAKYYDLTASLNPDVFDGPRGAPNAGSGEAKKLRAPVPSSPPLPRQ